MSKATHKMFVIASFLFLASTSLDVVYHAYSDSETAQIECQFCKNEISDTVVSSLVISTVTLSETLSLQMKDVFFSLAPRGFQSRAPPKI